MRGRLALPLASTTRRYWVTQAVLAQQPAQHQFRRLRPQLAVHVHIFDGDVAVEVALQAQLAQHRPRVVARRVGEQNFATGQAAQQPSQAPLEFHHLAQRRGRPQVVGLAQKVGGIDLVVAHHAQQGGAIPAPVADARGVDLRLGGRAVDVGEHARDIHIHVGADDGKNRMRGVMQGVVEVE